MLKRLMTIVALALFFPGCATVNSNKETETLHKLACSEPKKSDSVWNIKNLYNCTSKELFVPYQLWTGVNWDGNKNASCMHPADKLFTVNRDSRTTIKGPKKWVNPRTGRTETIWSREKTDGSKQQYFVCHEKGIGRVYDSRGPRYWDSGRCKFPAGHGWKLSVRRYCISTSIEITKISLDRNQNLSALEFKWWTRSTLSNKYRYVPNKGMTNAWSQ